MQLWVSGSLADSNAFAVILLMSCQLLAGCSFRKKGDAPLVV
jgi:hypothetical protein